MVYKFIWFILLHFKTVLQHFIRGSAHLIAFLLQNGILQYNKDRFSIQAEKKIFRREPNF